jgi:hypothetical protein
MELIKVQDGTATRDPLPDFLTGLAPESLADLSWITDPTLAAQVQGCAWWPLEDQSPALGQHQSYGDEALTIDAARQVVVRVRAVTDWSAEQVAASQPARHITVLAFRNRYTTAEKVALEIAALDDPAAPMTARQQAAALRANVKDCDTARYIDLDRPDTRAAVQSLEAGGLLAAGRAVQILDTVIAAEERYTGS